LLPDATYVALEWGHVGRQVWLLVTVSTGSSSTLRVHAWRTLRSLGAVYLQQSVALLPRTADTERTVGRLLDRLKRDGGEGKVLPITIADAGEAEAMVERFRSERTDEYREVCERVPAFLEEIASELARGRATYTEVEESEADLARLQTWLGRITARDYLDASGRQEAEAAIDKCAAQLEEFEAAALAAESASAAGEKASSSRQFRRIEEREAS
jgi:hypothetical protein